MGHRNMTTVKRFVANDYRDLRKYETGSITPFYFLVPECAERFLLWCRNRGLGDILGKHTQVPFRVFTDLCRATDLIDNVFVSNLNRSRIIYILNRLAELGKNVDYLSSYYRHANQKDIVESEKKKPAWLDISICHGGNRFAFGLKNCGCQYRIRSNTGGCSVCGFSVGSGFSVSADDLIEQAKTAIKCDYFKTHPGRGEINTVEILSDGSWYSDMEVPKRARRGILRAIIGKGISRIVVESRPEYITRKKIKDDLSAIGSGVCLTIGVGIETADDFVNSFCINKGYSFRELKKVAECVGEFSPKVTLLAYNLFKPPFLTDQEAIKDSLSLLDRLNNLSGEFGIEIEIKIEPMVVAKHTVAEWLYNKEGYSAPSYWSVAELVASIIEKRYKISIRVGGRNDMCEIADVAAIRTAIGMFAPVDFIVYDAVQRFNRHGNEAEFAVDLKTAIKDCSYTYWKASLGVKETALDRLMIKMSSYGSDLTNPAAYKPGKDVIRRCYSALNEIEYSNFSQNKALEIAKQRNGSNLEDIIPHVSAIFRKNLLDVIAIRRVKILDNYLGLLQIEFSVIDSHRVVRQPIHGWLGIPTRIRVPLPKTNVFNIEYPWT
jgi:radical SAM enzyme (TIGR01210 family)